MHVSAKRLLLRVRVFALLLAAALVAQTSNLLADDAADAVISVKGQETGPTPFIARLQIGIENPEPLASITFAIRPKTGALARPLTATYSATYLTNRGQFDKVTGNITLPVFGLYAGTNNDVTLTFLFADHSSREESVAIAAPPYEDTCGYSTPEVLVPRSAATFLSYDYILIRNACGTSPAVIDTDGAVRWVGPSAIRVYPAIFYDGAIYLGSGTNFLRVTLDGEQTWLADYSSMGVTEIHHNIDRGKRGMLLELDTTEQFEATVAEVDTQGKILKSWDFAEIISAAMTAGGDNPAQFVQSHPVDWFHNNSVAYRKADDSLIVSSRENFVIAVDYNSGAIKWILGDTTKRWAEFPSLRKHALTLSPGSLPPIGQHSLSVLDDNNLLLFDNGQRSALHTPRGENRTYSAPRMYRLDTSAGTATEIWNFEAGKELFSPFCSGVYRDTGLSFLVDYALLGSAPLRKARLVGLTPTGEPAFAYQYPTTGCDTAFNAIPVHWERLVFEDFVTAPPTVALANVSTRGVVRPGEEGLIAGFIINGTQPKKMLIRGLGPSLALDGVSKPISDPVLSVHDAASVVAQNDNFDPAEDLGDFHPENSAESVVMMTLTPGAYTAVLSNKSGSEGVGLLEVYDLGAP